MTSRLLAFAFLGTAVAAMLLSLATSSASQSTQRRYINLPGRPVQAPFSDAVMVGDTLYVAGRIGIDPKTGQAPASLEDELRILFDAFEQVLSAGGMKFDDFVYVTVYCTDLSLYERFNAAYRARFSKDFPARAFLGAGSLLRGGHFEMQGIAVKR